MFPTVFDFLRDQTSTVVIDNLIQNGFSVDPVPDAAMHDLITDHNIEATLKVINFLAIVPFF